MCGDAKCSLRVPLSDEEKCKWEQMSVKLEVLSRFWQAEMRQMHVRASGTSKILRGVVSRTPI
jgi:hypothetical protein